MAGRYMTRRDLLCKAARGAGLVAGSGALLSWISPLTGDPFEALADESFDDLVRSAPLARYWVSTAAPEGQCLVCHAAGTVRSGDAYVHPRKVVQCLLCAQACLIPEGARGRCQARVNVAGRLYSLVYGRPVSIHTDPIEKKPFYHFLPGTDAYSLATSGCPLSCKFCQNWSISQARPEDHVTSMRTPAALVSAATNRSARSIAFTYNEPTVFIEYLSDIARAARPAGIRSVLVSCGYMNERPLDEMCDVLDAIKIDLKGFDESFYRDVCGASLSPVLRSIRQIARRKVHLEIVNLVVPTLNDSDAMLARLVTWVKNEVGPEVPLHFTRFHPDYQITHMPPTPVATLERARDMAMAQGLRFVYVGNVPGHAGNHTYCPGCGRVVVQRSGFFTTGLYVDNGRCRFCGHTIPGVWDPKTAGKA